MTLRPASRSLSRCDGLGTGYNTDVRIGTSSDQASETGTIDVVIQPSRKGQRNIVAEADHDPLVFSVELSGAWSGLRTRTEALGRILDRLGEQLCARDRFRDIAGPETAQGGPVERPRPQRARGLVPGERERAAAKAKGRISAVLSPGPPLAYRAPRLAER